MRDEGKKNILITAGGTGGHVFPALAVAKTLMYKYNIIWVGGINGIENKIVPKHNILLEQINITGLRQKGKLKLLIMPLLLIRACFQALIIIIRHRPKLVIGFGGYATFPISLMARILTTKVIIHEQNAAAGLTNRLLAKISNKVMVAFRNVLASDKTVLVGNPVREEILALENPIWRYKLRQNKLNILVLGGSQGAKILNDLLPQTFSRLNNIEKIVHQVGRGNKSKVEEQYKLYQMENVSVVEFIEDMAQQYANADLIICRSGASTVTEVCAVGIAAIFIPYPFAVDDHQRLNAESVAEVGGAKVINQNDLTIEKLVEVLEKLDRDTCCNMAIKANSLAIKDTNMRIKDIIKDLIKI